LFLNILDNAIRYTSSGGTITLSLRREDQTAVVSIADTGIGIPTEDLTHIFERFYRVDKARSPAEGGSGLGLAISQYIVEVHGGKIAVESKPGSGSTFTIYLPIK
jgi:signal transduction histidine kinase